MSRRERSFLSILVSNTAINVAGNVAQRALGLAVTLTLARGLGEETFGLYSYVVSYMLIYSFIADLGVERLVTREVARSPQLAGELLGSAMVVKLFLSLLGMAAAVGSAFVLDLPSEARYCILIAALGLPMTVELVFRGYFQSRYRVAYTYAATLPATVWTLGSAIVVTRYHLPLHYFFALGLAVAPLLLGTLFWFVRYRFHLVLRPRRARMPGILRDAMELGGFLFLFVLSARLDQVMLFHMRGDVEVARYAVGVRLSEALAFIPEVLLVTLFPLLVSSEAAAPERFHHTYRLGFKYLAGLAIFMALALTLLRRELVTALFGSDYIAAAPSLALLGWNMVFGYIGTIYLSLFLAQSRQRPLLLVSAGALLVNIGLNLALIPSYGAAGAAAATLAANFAGFLFWLMLPPTRHYMVTCLHESWPALVAASIVAVLLWVFGLERFPAVALLVVVYPALLWVLGGLAWRDIRLVQRLYAEEDPRTVS